MKTFTSILYWFLIAVAVIQFIPVNRTNKPIKKSENFTEIHQTPKSVSKILKKACYDCHSNETVYPDYAYFAPISWSVKHHINEGREHLNFSEWGKFNKDLKQNMLENTIHSVKDYSMPLPAYLPYHPEANLTKSERDLITKYFQEILDSGIY